MSDLYSQGEGHPHAKHFSDLMVWRESRVLAQEVFEATKAFPSEEKFALTDQIRRSSRSVGAQIAEAWAKRRYEKSFISKLTDGDGEQNETQHWLIVSLDSGYLDKSAVSELGGRCRKIGAMLGKMISLSGKFCGEINQETVTKLKEPLAIEELFSAEPLYHGSLFTDHRQPITDNRQPITENELDLL